MSTELPPGFLTLPATNDDALPTLRKKLALECLRRLLSQRAERTGTLSAPFEKLQTWLRALALGRERAALRRALSSVDVLAPALVLTEGGAVAPAPVLEQLVPALALGLVRALGSSPLSLPFDWEVGVSRLHDAARGRVLIFDPPARSASVGVSGLSLTTAAGERVPVDEVEPAAERPGLRSVTAFHPLLGREAPTLALSDGNPLSALEEHPDKAGNVISLGDRPLSEWKDALETAFGLIEVATPTLHAEMLETLERVVPVGYDAERHLSASYREAPGLVYLTLHPSPLTMAEALVHETQHGKLNTLSWFDPVLENAQSTWTESPVRPDLRPLWGVLLAVHAFVPVAALHLGLVERGHPLARTEVFSRRRKEVLEANASGLATLRRLAHPTEVGRRMLASLEELHERLAGAAQAVI